MSSEEFISILSVSLDKIEQHIDERFTKLDEENKQLKNLMKELNEKNQGLEMSKEKTSILLFGIKEDKQEEFSLVKT